MHYSPSLLHLHEFTAELQSSPFLLVQRIILRDVSFHFIFPSCASYTSRADTHGSGLRLIPDTYDPHCFL